MDILYKYRNWADDYHKKCLLNTEFYFSNSFAFNDPYDLNLPLIITGKPSFNVESMKQSLIEAGKKPTAEILKGLSDYWNNSEFRGSDLEIKTVENMKLETLNMEQKLRVLCLSKKNNSILMWGHYANSHKGICIGLDRSIINNKLKKEYRSNYRLVDVQYIRELPKITWDELGNRKNVVALAQRRYSTKSQHWSYEDEIRILVESEKNFSLSFDNQLISEVIFGARTPIDTKIELFNLCRKKYPHCSIYKATLREDKFEISIIEVSKESDLLP